MHEQDVFQIGDRVFLRLNLDPQDNKNPPLHRGCSGEVCDVRVSDGTVKICVGASLWLRCRPEWLERSPGEICLGINAMLTKPYPFYSFGMMVSDLCFPTESHGCFERMQRNWDMLNRSGLGFSFYDKLDASCSRETLHRVDGWPNDRLDKRIELILCEEIWPWERWKWPNIKDFHESIARALMSQWSNATCVMVLRGWNARQLQKSLGNVKRISYHDGSKFEIHYTPLCMTRSDPPTPVVGTEWTAIVIHPKMFDARLVSCTGKVFIPELVLKAMFSSKRTLQLCSYTGESAVSIMEYLKAIKKLHGVKC